MLDFLRRLLGRKTEPKPTVVQSIGDALAVEPGQSGQPLRDAVAAINRVHQDGNLPLIPLSRAPFQDRHGQCSLQMGKIAIKINLVGPHVELTTVHEIGHFLDYSGLGRPGELASETPGVLDGWRIAVKQSRNLQRLAPLLLTGANTTTETLPGGTVVEYEIDQDYLRYLLQPRELWARSYAQFIAVRSEDLTLRLQLDGLRVRPAGMFYYGEQWDGDDFLTISASIEAIFHDLGWM